MFFNFKKHLRRKIQRLLEKVIYESEEMTWKDELRAAETIKIYTELFDEGTEL